MEPFAAWCDDPTSLCWDSDTGFVVVAEAVRAAQEHIELGYVGSARLVQNSFIERFDNSFRCVMPDITYSASSPMRASGRTPAVRLQQRDSP